jgi:hypothetical protein
MSWTYLTFVPTLPHQRQCNHSRRLLFSQGKAMSFVLLRERHVRLTRPKCLLFIKLFVAPEPHGGRQYPNCFPSNISPQTTTKTMTANPTPNAKCSVTRELAGEQAFARILTPLWSLSLRYCAMVVTSGRFSFLGSEPASPSSVVYRLTLLLVWLG